MGRVLVVNPNSSVACSDAISAALEPFRLPGAPDFDVVTLRAGPPAIYSWRDWHSVVEPLCRLIEREPADAYVIACASIPASRPLVPRPSGRCSACFARRWRSPWLARSGSAWSPSSMHQRPAISPRCAMGLESRLAAEVALNVTMETLLEPDQHAPG
jgi:hypothetical protein